MPWFDSPYPLCCWNSSRSARFQNENLGKSIRSTITNKSIFIDIYDHISSSNRCGQKSIGTVEKIAGAEGLFNLVVKVINRITGRKLEPNKFKLEIRDNCFSSVTTNWKLPTEAVDLPPLEVLKPSVADLLKILFQVNTNHSAQG